MVARDVDTFGRELARRLAEALGGGLVGVYFVGSIAAAEVDEFLEFVETALSTALEKRR
jgi:uncharacterized protein (DUF697 family)